MLPPPPLLWALGWRRLPLSRCVGVGGRAQKTFPVDLNNGKHVVGFCVKDCGSSQINQKSVLCCVFFFVCVVSRQQQPSALVVELLCRSDPFAAALKSRRNLEI
jgi:hypothetical protein